MFYSSANDDEHENSVQHPAGNFLISPDSKLFPGSFNFMNTLHDHPALSKSLFFVQNLYIDRELIRNLFF